ncbi:MAG: type III-A CRISPR-associated RAMP protein Csm4 [Bdellovibrionales bacterium]|nr:type III-A CRISPR-associated RAMP protein Csm4 [Bdellovibrionales bacterium]
MKEDIKLYKLNFDSGFHIDSFGNQMYSKSQKFIHSDTLSSALISFWATQKPESFEEFIKDPPFLLSSAFPFFDNIFFFPVIKGKSLLSKDSKDNKAFKKVKKIEFIAYDLWEKLLKNPSLYLESINNQDDTFSLPLSSKEYKVYSSFLVPKNTFPEKKDFEKVYKEEKNTRTSVNRLSNKVEEAEEGNLFQFSTTRYSSKKKAGLYFLVKFSSSKVKSDFEFLLSLLGDTGIGADKSSGKGQFSFEEVDCPIKQFYSDEPSFAYNCSLFSPSIKELEDKSWIQKSKYELIRRRGWIHNYSFRKKSIFMFKEGSCFPISKENSLKGEMKDVSPDLKQLDHKIYRDGRAFFIYFKRKD